ncbi:MAG TPA: glycosyltransferase [Thermoanaerobaculaceae bacterium]|nr:glycosyltransferase [Thermoanaerobaculaceae bacterium]
MSANDLVSVVLPVYGQAGFIAAVVEEYGAALENLRRPYELLLVVNGRPVDDSLEVCRGLERSQASVRTLATERGGWGWAVRQGLAAARGGLLCYTNSARTTAEDLVLHLMCAVAFPGRVIKANRKIRDNAFRRLGSLAYNIQCRALFDLPWWDINGTPKVFPRSFGPLVALSRDDDLIDLEFSIVCRREHYPMLEIPAFSTRRHGGASTTGVASAVRLYAGAFRMRREIGRPR